MATHSSILAWEIPWTEEPGRTHSPWGHNELDRTGDAHTTKHRESALYLSLDCIRQGVNYLLTVYRLTAAQSSH